MANDIVLAIDGTNRVHRLWHVTHDAAQCVRQFVRDVGALADAIDPAWILVLGVGNESEEEKATSA